jgi:hypothetical protein
MIILNHQDKIYIFNNKKGIYISLNLLEQICSNIETLKEEKILKLMEYKNNVFGKLEK